MRTATANGYPIQVSDKGSGIITTGYKMDGTALRTALVGQSRSMVSFQIIPRDANSCQLVVTIGVEQQGSFGTWKAWSGSKSQVRKVYESWFTAIQQSL